METILQKNHKKRPGKLLTILILLFAVIFGIAFFIRYSRSFTFITKGLNKQVRYAILYKDVNSEHGEMLDLFSLQALNTAKYRRAYHWPKICKNTSMKITTDDIIKNQSDWIQFFDEEGEVLFSMRFYNWQECKVEINGKEKTYHTPIYPVGSITYPYSSEGGVGYEP